MGSVYKRGNVWWIKYYSRGRPIRESADTDKETLAKRLLRQREGDVARGVPVTPQTNRARLEELFEDVARDYRTNRKRSADAVEWRIRLHLAPFFGRCRAANVTTDLVRKYVDHRQGEGAANATINRELAVVKRAFVLAVQGGKVTTRPHIPMLREDNTRSGFFEPDQFKAVRAALPEVLRGVVTFAYVTGWRVPSEVLRLEWRQVDFEAGSVRLDPGTTKNGEGRVFPFTVELRAVLEAQRAYTAAVQRGKGMVCPWVFHRAGRPIRYFRRAWISACKAAGVPGRIPHDFRRTAVRGLVRAGVPERVAMTMTGHKTRSVFERYNIVSEGDLAEAARKLDEAAGTITGTMPTGFTGTAKRGAVST